MTVRGLLLSAGVAVLCACHGGGLPPGGADGQGRGVDDSGAESGVGEAAGGKLGLGQVDRDGHPLVALLLVPARLQDEYNGQNTFDPVPRILQDALESRLVQWDVLSSTDGGPDPIDWPVPDGGAHPLLPLFVSDELLVDTSLSCLAADGGFAATYLDLDLEANALGPPHTTCGGRTPSENVVDKTLTLLVTANRDGGSPPTQGLAGPTKPATTHFPYFAEPN